MRVAGKVVVITGAGGGIGAALAGRFAAEGAAGLVLADSDGAAARRVAGPLGEGAVAVEADVTGPAANADLVATAERAFGPVDLFCANAGVMSGTGVDAPEHEWARAWSVNVMAHVHGAQAVLPSMLARGGGHLLVTASAAGLLTAYGDAPYSVTKHAVVGFAEWLAISYGDRGIGVSVLCPMGVDTAMLTPWLARDHPAANAVAAAGEVIAPERVADAVVEGLAADRLHILPHPEVAAMYARRAADPDRWVGGMRRFYRDWPSG